MTNGFVINRKVAINPVISFLMVVAILKTKYAVSTLSIVLIKTATAIGDTCLTIERKKANTTGYRGALKNCG
jgi:hypothetical protein|tara:strand:- start:886 stop:1101 length:216 start_codon:yes stop_codon:yes gene_type:complete